MDNNDRTVFVRLPDGAEVVRYNRAGQWYMERPNAPRSWLKVADAASWATTEGAVVFPKLPGGRSFYCAVRRLTEQLAVSR